MGKVSSLWGPRRLGRCCDPAPDSHRAFFPTTPGELANRHKTQKTQKETEGSQRGLFFKSFTYDRVYQCVSTNITLRGHRPPAVPVDLVLLFPQHTRWNLGACKGLGFRFAIESLMYSIHNLHHSFACRDTKKIHIQSCTYMNILHIGHILHHTATYPVIHLFVHPYADACIHQHMHTSAHKHTHT